MDMLNNEKDAVELFIYADEIKQHINKFGENWAYIGVLAIPKDKVRTAYNRLMEARNEVQYFGEVHFSGLRAKKIKSPRVILAGRWLDLILNDTDKCFYFYVLGINLTNLTHDVFADTKTFSSIYNRFFRTAVSFVLNGYFGLYKKVNVIGILHDAGNMEHDDYFDWHTIWKIDNDDRYPNICFNNQLILFIDSNHEKEKTYPAHSHFVQLIDVVLGTLAYSLDYRVQGCGADYLAEKFSPLVIRLTDNKTRNNPNSRYKYHRKYSISFFPSERLSTEMLRDDTQRCVSTFYHNRKLLWSERCQCELEF